MSVMGGVVLGGGAMRAMETSMMQGVDDRPAARAVEACPRLMGVRGLLPERGNCEGIANLMDRIFVGEVSASVNLGEMAVLTLRVGRALGFRE